LEVSLTCYKTKWFLSIYVWIWIVLVCVYRS